MKKTKKQLQAEIEKLQKQIKELEDKDFIEIKCKKLNKTFRIYKWENKPFKDFPMPKGFNWAKYSDFVYLYDNDLIELEKYLVEYYVENYSKKNIKNGYDLSRLFVYGDGGLYSEVVVLADSGDYSRVVVVK